VKAVAALLALLATSAGAATAYVTDELVLGVYTSQNTQGQRLATLHSGAVVETLAAAGESTQVRLLDGTIGWVKTAYLTDSEPATVRIKQLQDELDRSRANPPAQAEAAEHSEVDRLTRELADLRRATEAAPSPAPSSEAAPTAAIVDMGAPAKSESHWWPWVAGLGVGLSGGFWLGYATLARRIRHKFGGIKVY
jgi:hypothetical protein